MMARSGIALKNLPDDEIQKWVGSFDNALFDCDGKNYIQNLFLLK